MTSWREQLHGLLSLVPASRPPALRRSLKPDWLYSVDLPRCAAPEACAVFENAAVAAGWETLCEETGWIQLRKLDDIGADNVIPEGFGMDRVMQKNWLSLLPDSGEAHCIRVLSALHPSLRLTRNELIRLLKAEEIGPEALENACQEIHRHWAVLLRQKRTPGKLPEAVDPF